ncbi:hypothetical protein IQ268_14625 [Oculatella sp. LEGE 06141]|uniref:hypothetical protein n=1 Tax=Oculatella sp. LEGE 06141 TaxID=1828648 RepID=UPI001882EB8F|nr:hypothetical protein [Oculatella sp. LEGE 06141]MBE9179802.1 hypothetical protein [Oculatella sp. LEGE 06141]
MLQKTAFDDISAPVGQIPDWQNSQTPDSGSGWVIVTHPTLNEQALLNRGMDLTLLPPWKRPNLQSFSELEDIGCDRR